MANAADLRIRITADGTQAVRRLDEVNGALRRHNAAAAAAERQAAALRGAFMGMAAAAAGAVGIGAMADAFLRANIESERLLKGLTAVAGSAALGAQEMAYVKAQADRLGISVNALGTSYVSLLAATKNTTMEGEATRKIFESVSLAMAKLGKSSADAQGALTAIQQSISKQKVSAEELTQQLGERLPGATKAFADSLGVTTTTLMEMMSKGELTIDMWEQFAAQLNKIYDDGNRITGLTAEWERYNNALDDFYVALNDATGATDILAGALANAAGNARALTSWTNGEGWNNFTTQLDRQNALMTDKIRLTNEFKAKAQEVANLDALPDSGWITGMKRELPGAQAELIAIGNELGVVTAKIAGMQEANKQLAQSSNNAKTAAAGQADGLSALDAQFAKDDATFTQLNKTYDDAKQKREALKLSIDNLDASYDKTIDKAQKIKAAEEQYTAAAAAGLITKDQATAKIAAYAAGLDKATTASRSHAAALSAEAQVVAQVEQKYGLMKGQLDAVWKLESSRGKTAGTGSERWVKDLAAGEGHMTKIVGQFQMAESTAKGLGANMATFNGQADAAGKYLAQAAAQGKTLWEQFATYHGGPNEKAWGEKTRAYADAAVKIVADATGSMEDLGQSTGKTITDSLNKANAAVQSLIERYLPARAAAEEYAQAQQALALASDAAGLSQEEQAIILQGLQQDLEKSKTKATETANAWAEVWKNAVKRIDDTFAGLWKDLFSGTKSTLESMKSAISSWLAEVAHALLTKPLVVAITTAMTGATGVAGAAGTAAQAASGASSLGGFSNFTSLASNIFSLGTSFISGVSAGFQALFSGTFGTAMEFAGAGIMSGTGSGMAAGLGAMMPILAPLAIAGGFILNKYFQDQKPRYGAYGATTTGRNDQFEDGVGVKGAFGLTFGMNDMGTANVDAEEQRQLLEGFAAVSTAMANFYGKDVEAAVKASLAKASMENWGKNGLMNYAMSAEQAFQIAFTDIIAHAAATGDTVAVVMSSVVGSLQGTMEDMANQIERGMLAAKAAVGMAEAFQGQDMGDRLGLGNKDTLGNALKLVDYANTMKTAGETTAEAIGRMAINLGVLDAALTLTGTTTDATGMAFIDLANSLATAADEAKIGMQGLMQLQAAYYQNFYSEEERALKQKEDSLKAIARWQEDQDLKGIDSSAAFRKYVESLDLTTEAGRKAYVEAMKIVGAFISLDDALKKLGDASTVAADKLKSLQDLINALDPNRDRDLNSLKRQDDARQALLKTGYQGDFTGADIAAYIDHLMQLGGAFKLSAEDLLKFKDGLLLLAEIAAQKADMEIRILELTGRSEEALAARRAQELAALDPSLRALQERIWALEDEAAALAQLEDLTLRLAEAVGNDAFIQRIQREKELAAALNETNRTILLMLYSAQDLRNGAGAVFGKGYATGGIARGPKSGYGTTLHGTEAIIPLGDGNTITAKLVSAQASSDPTLSGLGAIAIVAQALARAAASAKQDTASIASLNKVVATSQASSLDAWKSALDLTKLTAEQLQDHLESLQKMISDLDSAIDALSENIREEGHKQFSTAQMELHQILLTARKGTLPTAEALAPILESLTADSRNQFGSQEEYLRAMGRTRGELEELKKYTQKELTDTEKLIKAIEAGANKGAAGSDSAADKIVNGISADMDLLIAIAKSIGADIAPLDANLDRKLTFDELKLGLGLIATDDELRAIFDLLDTNHDGILSEMEALALNIATNLYPAFDKLDKNLDGKLTFNELKDALGSIATDEQIKAMMMLLDTNHDGVIDKMEALQAGLAQEFAKNFINMDINKNGLLTAAELKEAMGPHATDAQIKAMMDLLDLNHDGILSALEALPLMMASSLDPNFTKLDKNLDGKLTFDELKLGLGGIATDEQIRAMMKLMDTNGDGIITKIEAMTYEMKQAMATTWNKMDANNDDKITLDEFKNTMAPLGTSADLAKIFASLDLNGDGILTAIEALPLQMANSLSGYFDKLDKNMDGKLTFDELKVGLGGMATDSQLKWMMSLMDINHDGMISVEEASKFKLEQIQTQTADTMYLKNINATNEANKLSLINVDSATKNIKANIDAVKTEVTAIVDGLILSDLDRLVSYAATSNARGYATGGIATGPSSGYEALLHGREAIIPLGDGNSITAHLTSPLPPAPNLINREAGDSLALRQALAELQAEVQALRRDQQSAAAATVGELRDHNRRERKRDVVGQKVEVIG